ncbi:hypothetical protein J132_07361 [Termitomyces sp. J132]|nr:hypothetical protein J132_07361 [Termitomyces sp. J132]
MSLVGDLLGGGGRVDTGANGNGQESAGSSSGALNTTQTPSPVPTPTPSPPQKPPKPHNDQPAPIKVHSPIGTSLSSTTQHASQTTSTTSSTTSLTTTTSNIQQPTQPAPTLPPSTSIAVSTKSVITSTSDQQITASSLPSPTSTQDTAAKKGFFQNTAAVAGTFSAVGIVLLVLLTFLLTALIRRRRQAKFNRELDEATAEAANASAPAFLLDDAYDTRAGGGGAVFSDASSHGTYAQPPMSTETYGMREVGGGVAGVGAGMAYMGYEYDPYAPTAAYRHAQGPGYTQQDVAYPSAAAYPSTTPAAAVAAATAAAADYTHGGPTPAIAGYNTYADPTTPVHAHAYTPTSTHQLLEAAGLEPPARSSPSALTHHEEYLPNPFDTLPLQLRPGGGGEDAYAGYVDEYGVPRRVQGGDAHERELEHAGDERGSYCEPDAEQPRVLKASCVSFELWLRMGC